MKAPKFFSTKRQAIEDAKQTVLMVVVIAAVIVSIALVTVNFLYDLSRYNARVIAEKEEAVETINANIEAVSELVDSFRAFEEGPDLIPAQGEKNNSSIVLDALPSKYDFPALATSMESIAKKSGLRLDSFSGQDQTASAVQSAAEPSPVEIPFSLVLIGPYEDIQDFTNQVQTSIRTLTVDRVKLSGSDESIRAEVDIRAFYQPSVSLDIETQVVQ